MHHAALTPLVLLALRPSMDLTAVVSRGLARLSCSWWDRATRPRYLGLSRCGHVALACVSGRILWITVLLVLTPFRACPQLGWAPGWAASEPGSPCASSTLGLA